MSRRTRLLMTAAGSLVFAFLVYGLGPSTIVDHARRTGWMAVPIVLVFLPVYLCNAWAWHTVLSASASRPPFLRTFAITVAGFAINYMTPVVSLGGEPFKIAAVTPWTGASRATSSVIVFGMLHALSHLFIWLTAAIIALIILPQSVPLTISLVVAGGVLLIMIGFVLGRHRKGVLEDLLAIAARLPLLCRLALRWDGRRDRLARIDAQISEFYNHDRGRFFLALSSEYVGRAISVIEFWLILISLGYEVGYLQAFLIGSFASLVLNILFFVPFALGTKEGGVLTIVNALGFPVGAGVYASLVTRLRELVWIAIGLSLIPFAGRSRPAQQGDST